MSREFFNSNKIQNFTTFTPNKTQSSISNHFHTTQKLKRVTSCRDTTVRLNPEKFVHRQVFSSKLYSVKPFNIAVEFNKESQDKIHQMYSFENDQNVQKIQKKIRKQAAQQFVSGINNLSHYFRTVHKEMDSEGMNGSIKKQMILLKEGFDKVIKILCKEIENFEESYVKLMFEKKSGQKLNQMSVSRVDQLESSKLISSRKGLGSSGKLLESTIYNNLGGTTHEKGWLKPSTSSSLRTSRILQQKVPHSSSNQVKTLTNKLNLVEFENKKHILRIQSLQNDKKLHEEIIKQLEKKIDSMSERIQKVNQSEDFFNYKIKKLKEQLEVAHIVKEQNLAEKMKYIMGQ